MPREKSMKGRGEKGGKRRRGGKCEQDGRGQSTLFNHHQIEQYKIHNTTPREQGSDSVAP